MKGMSNAVRIFGYRVESLNNKSDNKSEVAMLKKNTGRRIFIQSTLNRKESTNDKK